MFHESDFMWEVTSEEQLERCQAAGFSIA